MPAPLKSCICVIACVSGHFHPVMCVFFLLLLLQLSCGGLCKCRCEADGPGSWPGSETNDPEPEETRHADIISPHQPLHQTKTVLSSLIAFSDTFKTIKKNSYQSVCSYFSWCSSLVEGRSFTVSLIKSVIFKVLWHRWCHMVKEPEGSSVKSSVWSPPMTNSHYTGAYFCVFLPLLIGFCGLSVKFH